MVWRVGPAARRDQGGAVNEPGRIRLFVAAEIPPTARGALGLLQATLRERIAARGAG